MVEKGKDKPITMLVPTLCDWFSFSATAATPTNYFSLPSPLPPRKQVLAVIVVVVCVCVEGRGSAPFDS